MRKAEILEPLAYNSVAPLQIHNTSPFNYCTLCGKFYDTGVGTERTYKLITHLVNVHGFVDDG